MQRCIDVWKAEEAELEELKAAKPLLSSGEEVAGAKADVDADDAEVCFEGGLGMTGAGGGMTDEEDMLLERLEQELDCVDVEKTWSASVAAELTRLDSAKRELRAAYLSSGTAANVAGAAAALVC